MFRIFLGAILAACLFFGSASAQSRDITIDGDHGKLSAVLQTPDGKKNFPLVIICHGFTGNKDEPLMVSLANSLEQSGIASIRFDFNGHGKSDGNFSDMTVLNEIEDAKKVYDYASKIDGVTNISIAGHSQGGVVASMVAGELGAKKIKALALLAPAAVLREDAVRGSLFDVKFDPVNPPEYVEIFGGHKVGRNYILTAQTLPIFETAKKFTGPTLMIHGTGDTVVPYTYSLRYQEIFPNSRLELLKGFDHGLRPDIDKAVKITTEFFSDVKMGR